MAIARSIAPHLPYLRRFARALEGAQAGGDAFVAATLEALIADWTAPRDPQDAMAELQARGIYKTAYAGGTLRANAATINADTTGRPIATSTSTTGVGSSTAPGSIYQYGCGLHRNARWKQN